MFTQDFFKTIDVSLNFFARAEDSTGAYGANVVDCKEAAVYFGIAKLGPEPSSPNGIRFGLAIVLAPKAGYAGRAGMLSETLNPFAD